MSEQKIEHATEEIFASDTPVIDGDWIRNLAILGPLSPNPADPSNPSGPRRSYRRIIAATEEVAKFSGRKSYIGHLPGPHPEADELGNFANPRQSADYIRADLECRKLSVNGQEQFHPQVLALRDNIENKRAFGGFSPDMDFQIDTASGDVLTLHAVNSIDLVSKPATVKSALEEVRQPEVSRAEFDALKASHEALVAGLNVKRGQESSARSDPLPEVKSGTKTSAKSIAEFVRS